MVRVGLAGYASAGRGIHAPLIAGAGLDLVAVATSNAERRAEVAADFPDARVVDDLDALIALGDLDLIVLATPSGSHAEHAEKVIEAGVACVVDKPLAVNADDAQSVVDAAERAGVPLTVFHNRRYDPAFATLATVVADRLAGEPFRCEQRWERWRPVPKDRWRENAPAAEGGGIMLDLHSHLVDSAVQLFGPILTVFATVESHTTPAEDDAFLVCRHASGVVSHLGATSVSGAAGPRVRLLGREAAYVQNDFEGEPNVFPDTADADADHCGWLYRASEREAVPTTASSQVDFYRAVGAALAAPDRQAAMPVDPRDAIHTLAVLDAARASAEGERVVEVITPGCVPDTRTRSPEMSDDHKAVLHRYLRRAREAVMWKLDGLSEHDIRRPLTPTGTNLLGVVKHLAGVEAGYFGDCLGRPVPDMPDWYAAMMADEGEDNADLWVTADESRESILDLYATVAAHADAVIDELDLGDTGDVPWWGEDGMSVSVQWLLVHMIAETNRHAGHIDIVRELIDGAVGMRPDASNLPDGDADYWDTYRKRLQDTADQFR